LEENRAHLGAAAHRMAGRRPGADEAGRESWPLLARAETSGMDHVGPWLTTVVARECLACLAPAPLGAIR